MARPATAAVRLLTGEREPVRLATTGNIKLSGPQTIDGVLAAVGDRVLVTRQTDGSANGIYTASEGQWYRAADARTARTIAREDGRAMSSGGCRAAQRPTPRSSHVFAQAACRQSAAEREPSRCRAQQTQPEDGAAMCVHATGDREHGVLGIDADVA